MNIHDDVHGDDTIESIIKSIEKETGKKVFTLRIIEDEDEPKNDIEVLIVFEDKNVMHAKITVQAIDGQLGCRVRGNFI